MSFGRLFGQLYNLKAVFTCRDYNPVIILTRLYTIYIVICYNDYYFYLSFDFILYFIPSQINNSHN